MEIRINKEIKDYRESLFLGLSTRQFLCSVGALGTAVGIYFGLRNVLDKELVSWLCILCSAPLAIAGFFKYHGMNFEQFIVAYVRSTLGSKVRIYQSENYLYDMYEEVVADVYIQEKKVKK